MHDHTSPATETVTLYAADASANGTVTAQSPSVEHLARRLGLGRAQLSGGETHLDLSFSKQAISIRQSLDGSINKRGCDRNPCRTSFHSRTWAFFMESGLRYRVHQKSASVRFRGH